MVENCLALWYNGKKGGVSMKLLISALTKYLAGLFLVGLILFLPAGTLNYPGGWLFCGLLFVPMFLLGVVLFIKAPDLLAKRLRSKENRTEQKQVVGLSALMFVGGSSAGGYLSMMLCFDKRYLEKHGICPMDISGFVHDSGQPTSHFNVLKEMGKDFRRVIVDETAPLYFVGIDPEYPPMLLIVADQDMENRYEQTVLVRSTMEHFEYDMSKVELKLMHGRHCAHVSADNEQGENVLGTIVRDFILKEI